MVLPLKTHKLPIFHVVSKDLRELLILIKEPLPLPSKWWSFVSQTEINKRLEHCVQRPRSMVGFVAPLNLSEVPENAPLRDVINFIPVTCQHSMLGIAPPAPNGILWGVSSHPGNTQEQHSTATCDSQQVRVCASLSSVWGQEIHRRAVQPATAHFLSLKALQHPPYQADKAEKAHEQTWEKPAF